MDDNLWFVIFEVQLRLLLIRETPILLPWSVNFIGCSIKDSSTKMFAQKAIAACDENALARNHDAHLGQQFGMRDLWV